MSPIIKIHNKEQGFLVEPAVKRIMDISFISRFG